MLLSKLFAFHKQKNILFMVTTKQRRLQMVENGKAENALLKLKRFSENGYDEFIEKYRLLH